MELHNAFLVVMVTVLSANLSSVSGADPMILWTQKSHMWSKIRGIIGHPDDWVNQKTKPYVSTDSTSDAFLYALAYNPARNDILWSDKRSRRIYRQPLSDGLSKSSDNQESLFYEKSSNVSAIAVDFLAGNVYIADAGNEWIAVASANRNKEDYYKVLFGLRINQEPETVVEPGGIAVDPYEGLVFWTQVRHTSKLEIATTDGRNRRELVYTNLFASVAITADIADKRVYWLNGDNIESVNYEGLDRRQITFDQESRGILSLSVFQNYLFASTAENLQLVVWDKNLPQLLREHDVDAYLYHLALVDDTVDRPPHDCSTLECHDLCLNTGDNQGVCACRHGYLLQADGQTCLPRNTQSIIIHAHGNAVGLTDLQLEDNPSAMKASFGVLRDDVTNVRAVGAHVNQRLAYFADMNEGVVSYGNVQQRQWKDLTVQTGTVQGVTVDWLAGNIYWTDSYYGHIMTSHLDGRFHKILVRNLGQPLDISVDPVNKMLFWTNRDGNCIEVANLDGSGIEKFVPFLELDEDFEIQGLTLDPKNRRLYWVSNGSGIFSTTYEFEQVTEIMDIHTDKKALYDVSVFQGYVAWTTDGENMCIALESNSERLYPDDYYSSLESQTYQNAYGLVALDEDCQPYLETLCSIRNGGCSQLCFEMETSRRCECAIGFKMSSDGVTCIPQSGIKLEHFTLFLDPYHKQIYQIDDVDTTPRGVPLPAQSYPISVDFDSVNQQYVWVDEDELAIKRANMTVKESEILHTFDKDNIPHQIIIDASSRYMFIADSTSIKRINLDDIPSGATLIDNADVSMMAVDHNYESPYDGRLYWSNYDRIESADFNGDNRELLFDTEDEQITAFAIYSGDFEKRLYYVQDKYVYEVNLNDTEENRTLIYNSSDVQIDKISTSEDYLYLSVWNKKGVYRIPRSTDARSKRSIYDGVMVPVVDEIFARIVDLRSYGRSVIPIQQPTDKVVVVPPPLTESDPNLPLIIGAALGALVLVALIILAAICGRRRCGRMKGGGEGDSNQAFEDTEWTAHDDPELNIQNPDPFLATQGMQSTNVNEGVVCTMQPEGVDASTYDILRHQADVHNRPASNGSANGRISNGSAAGRISNGSTNGRLSNGSTNGRRSNGSAHAVTNPANRPISSSSLKASMEDLYGPDDLAETPVAIVPPFVPPVTPAPATSGKFKKNTTKHKKSNKKTNSSDYSDFTLSSDKNVATVIQRIATRLRNRLSSVRWNENESQRQPNIFPPNGQNGNEVKDNPNGDGEPYNYNHKPQKKPAKSMVYIPTKLHKEPRGWAPASHNVPRDVKTTWGRSKAKSAFK